MTIPSVDITVVDNGASAAITLPQQKVQVKIGPLLSNALVAANVPFSTTNPGSIQQNLIGGQLCEAAGMVAQAGGTVICVGAPIVTKGTASSVVATVPGGSTSTLTTTLDSNNGAWDDYYVELRCITGGTIGTAGIQVDLSLSAGRNRGPILNLGTATSLAIPNTGITLNFGAGTMVAGDKWRFSTKAPLWNDAGVQNAILALAASQYAIAGWGSMHIVGQSSASDLANFQTYLETLRTQSFIFTRTLTDARDAQAPTAWGGSGESEITWMSSLATQYGATSAKRVATGGGFYNMPSAFPNQFAGTPSYRRCLTWADAVRRVLVPPQRRGGRVSDGALSSIVVDPANDPADGFVYHDERQNPGLDAARLISALTWPKKQAGFYIAQEPLLAPNGSQYSNLVLGNVIDLACDIAYATGVNEVNDDLRTTDAGTLFPHDAMALQNTIDGDLKTDLTDNSFVSDAFCTVEDRKSVV